jgi:hypothetical protein
MVAGLPGLLVVTSRVIWKMRQARDSQRYIASDKYDTIVSKKMRECTVGEYWKPIILFRWTITNCIIIFLRDHPEMQVILLLSLSVCF